MARNTGLATLAAIAILLVIALWALFGEWREDGSDLGVEPNIVPGETRDRHEVARADRDLVSQSEVEETARSTKAVTVSGRVLDGMSAEAVKGAAIEVVTRARKTRGRFESEGITFPALPISLGRRGCEVRRGKAANSIWLDEDLGLETAGFTLEWPYELARTDEKGRFTIDVPLDPGCWIVISAPGFCDVILEYADVRKHPGSDFDVLLWRPGRLIARVNDVRGHPVGGFAITACLNDDVSASLASPAQRSVRSGALLGRPLVGLRWRLGYEPTDSQGIGVLDDLPVGTALRVAAYRGDYVRTASTWIDPEVRVNSVTFTVRTVGAIRGRVVRSLANGGEREPAGNVSVHFSMGREGCGDNVRTTARTDERGRFLLQSVDAAVGLLCVDNGARTMPVEVKPAETLEVGTIILPAYVPLSGRVVCDQPLDYGQVRLTAYRSGQPIASLFPKEDGSFGAEVPAGQALILASLKSRSKLELARVLVSAPDENVEIRLSGQLGAIAGAISDEALIALEEEQRSPSDSSTTGRTGDAGMRSMRHLHPSTGAPRLRVHLLVRDGRQQWKIAQSFQCRIEDNRFICPGAPSGDYAFMAYLGRVMTSWIPQVKVESGVTTELGQIPIGGGTISGKVLDAGSRPVSGATVMVASGMRFRGWKLEVTSDSDGLFSVTSMSSGPMTVIAKAKGGRLSAPLFVDLEPGQIETVTLPLYPGGVVEGDVTRGGVPVTGMTLVLEHLDARERSQTTTTTDTTGHYVLGDLAPGAYRLDLEKEPGRSGDRTRFFELSAAQHEQVSFELEGNPVRLSLTERGRFVTDLASASIICIDRANDHYRERRRCRINPEGTFDADLFESLTLVQAQRAGELRRSLVAILDGSTASGAVSVPVPTGTVRVSLGPSAAHMPPPELSLIALPEGDLGQILIMLPRTRITENELLFASIPEGAHVRLGGRLEGSPSKSFLFMGDGTLEMTWP